MLEQNLRKPLATPGELARRMAATVCALRPQVDRFLSGDTAGRELPAERRAGNIVQAAEEQADMTADSWAQVAAFSILVDRFVARACGKRLRMCEDPAIAELLAEWKSTLDEVDVSKVLEPIRHRHGAADPLVHFYELFLASYDPAQRRRRGVYYTPGAIVSYIVRSVDHLLRHQLAVPGGLVAACNGTGRIAGIVDPACGSGTFLSAVVDHVLERVDCRRGVDCRAARASLARKLLGYELLAAPCKVANLLLGSKLDAKDWSGVRHASPLEVNQPMRELLCGRRDSTLQPLVVIGNPPYANFGGQNRSRWVLELLDDYKRGLEERKLNLNDDFIKFFRWGQYWIDKAGTGVLALVTNNTYLSGLTHRQMRRSLLESFDQIYLLDLHGSSKKRERSPGGEADENVFNIQTGIAVGVFVKGANAAGKSVHYADMWGSRASKLRRLEQSDVGSVKWRRLELTGPQRFFVPRRHDHRREYGRFERLDRVFRQYVSGVQTKRDALFVDLHRRDLAEKMQRFFRSLESPRDSDHGDNRLSVPPWLRRRTAASSYCEGHIVPYLVAPFDERWIYYDPALLGRARYRVMRHMLSENLGLVFMRQSTNEGLYDHLFVCRSLVSDRVFYSAHGAPFLAPLWLYHNGLPSSNLTDPFQAKLARKLRHPCASAPQGDLERTWGVQDAFHYVVAILSSVTFRLRYAHSLRIDFPRVPLTSDWDLFVRLCRLGEQLVQLQLLTANAGRNEPQIPSTAGPVHVERGYPRYAPCRRPGNQLPQQPAGNGGRIALNATTFLDGVGELTWLSRIGGYHVLHRWLRCRRGIPLESHDLEHFGHIASALHAMRGVGEQIDQAICSWPLE